MLLSCSPDGTGRRPPRRHQRGTRYGGRRRMLLSCSPGGTGRRRPGRHQRGTRYGGRRRMLVSCSPGGTGRRRPRRHPQATRRGGRGARGESCDSGSGGKNKRCSRLHHPRRAAAVAFFHDADVFYTTLSGLQWAPDSRWWPGSGRAVSRSSILAAHTTAIRDPWASAAAVAATRLRAASMPPC